MTRPENMTEAEQKIVRQASHYKDILSQISAIYLGDDYDSDEEKLDAINEYVDEHLDDLDVFPSKGSD